MSRRSLPFLPFGVSFAVLLTACGGGFRPGDFAPPDTITSENSAELAAVLRSVGGLVAVASRTAEWVETGSPPASGGGEGFEDVPCVGGGYVRYEFADVLPMGALSPDDVLDLYFHDCEEAGTTASDGVLSYLVQQYAQNETASELQCTFLGGFDSIELGMPVGRNGRLDEIMEIDRVSGDVGLSLTGRFQTRYTQEDGSELSSDLRDLELTYDVFAEMGVRALRFDCFLESNVAGDWDLPVRTLEDFVQYDMDAYPAEGRLSIYGGGDVLYVTAQPDAVHLLLELDSRGNGSVDWSELVRWDELGVVP